MLKVYYWVVCNVLHPKHTPVYKLNISVLKVFFFFSYSEKETFNRPCYQTKHCFSLTLNRPFCAPMRCGNFFLFAVPDQSSTAISTSYRRTKPQGVLQTAAGSRASSASPNTGRTSIAHLDRMERSVWFIYITVIYLMPEESGLKRLC